MIYDHKKIDELAQPTERELLVAHTVKIETLCYTMKDMSNDLNKHYERLDRKVDWKNFKWVIGIAISGIVCLLGYTNTLGNTVIKNSIAIETLKKKDVKKLLIKHEGLELHPYKCTAGKWSIGIGRNLNSKGITQEEALHLFNNDVNQCTKDLMFSFFPNQFLSFPESIQSVLINMRFQLGHTRLKKFKKMLVAFRNEDYAEAAIQMEDSHWFSQVPKRAKELITIVKKEIK